MVACCSSIDSPVVPHAKVNIHSHSHTHKHTVSISNECVFRRHCHSHSMCLEAFNFGWLNSYVYCWNDQNKFHYRVLFYFCIMLGEVMMLAMNARRKKYLSEALYQGIIRWVVSQIESLNHLYNYITQSGSCCCFTLFWLSFLKKWWNLKLFRLKLSQVARILVVWPQANTNFVNYHR